MTRPIILVFLLIAGLCGAGVTYAQTRADSLAGAWIPVKQDLGGKPVPQAVFEKEKLIIGDSTYTVIAESVDKGLVKYNGHKMDIYGKDGVNAGKHFMAIYKLENGKLIICYNLQGDGYPETFDSTNKPLFFVSVFKKETN